MLKNEDQIIHFQKYLNNKHANLKLTCECENNRNLAFLDCSIKRKSNKFETSTHQKETFSGLGTNNFSFTPFIYKLNCLKTLIYCGYNISSNYLTMHSEFKFLCISFQ